MTMDGTSAGIYHVSIKQAHHNSQLWYKAVLKEYIEKFGDLPCNAGPAKDIGTFFRKIGV